MPVGLSKLASQEAADAAKRLAGQANPEKLTVSLMLEELRARKERGEGVSVRGGRRSDVLDELKRARRVVPNIPESGNLAVPVRGVRSAEVEEKRAIASMHLARWWVGV